MLKCRAARLATFAATRGIRPDDVYLRFTLADQTHALSRGLTAFGPSVLIAPIDKRLSQSRYLGGNEYSIADIATFPWLRSWQNQGVTLSDYPHLEKWFHEIDARPAVQRGVKVLAELRKPIRDEKEKEILFGKTQYERR